MAQPVAIELAGRDEPRSTEVVGPLTAARNAEDDYQTPEPLGRKALWTLAAQHISSTWGDRSAEFAIYLYLIELFRSTLLPASFFGFFTTSAAILFSGTVGSYVDSIPRLTLVRLCIVTQKVSAGIAYALILLLFLLRPLREGAEQGRSAPAPVWLIFSGVVLMGCVLKLSTIGISIAVERDWITTIADGDERRLGMLNTLIRRIDLISKLVAPLFVSMLTTTISYSWSVKILLGLAVTTLIFEYWCEDVLRLFILLVLTIYKGIGIVYNKLPTLSHPRSGGEQLTAEPSPVPPPVTRKSSPTRRLLAALQKQYRHWLEFIRHPIFPSSLAISALYMTVLSFDGAMVSYLKTHSYEDAFIAGMRGVAVVAGLAGTIAMPLMEKKLGLIRAGNWSIWGEVVSLIPALLSFYINPARPGRKAVVWNQVFLFGGVSLSRIYLWSFDLCQLKEIQLSLENHPNRNSLMALQFALQNVADLLRYVVTAICSQPSQFKIAAAVSEGSVILGALSYTIYVKRTRGHIFHLEWIRLKS